MNKNLNFSIALVAVSLSIFLGVALGRFTLNKWGVGTASPACSVTMTDIIASAQGDVYNPAEIPTDYVEPEYYYLVTYSVNGGTITDPINKPVPGNLIDEQKDTTLQTEAWDVFTAIIPAQDRQMLVQYNVFTDGNSNTLAAVDQRPDDPSKWMLEIDVADLNDRDALLFTLIHEYAHLLTLNDTQVIPDQEIVDDPTNVAMLNEKAAACPNYFAGTGCSYPDSYIHVFYNRFWVDINDEWEKIDALQYGEDDMLYFDGLYSFYKTHQDQFVDDYSTTHPAEDIAESFTYFVFTSRPTGDSIKEQKIAFFYEYPELVQLRENILNGACSLK